MNLIPRHSLFDSWFEKDFPGFRLLPDLRQERRYGKYSRSFTLGSGIDENAIAAHFADGVLTLDIPKAEPHAGKSKNIPVK